MSTPQEYLDLGIQVDANGEPIITPEMLAPAPVDTQEAVAPSSDILATQEDEELTWAQKAFDVAQDFTVGAMFPAASLPIIGEPIEQAAKDFQATGVETLINEAYTLYDPETVGRTGGVDLTKNEVNPTVQGVAQGIARYGIILGAGAAAAPLGVAAAGLASVVAAGATTVQGVRRQLYGVEEETKQKIYEDTGLEATPEQIALSKKTALPFIIVGQALDTVANIIPIGYAAKQGVNASKAFIHTINKIPGIEKLTPAGSKLIANSVALTNLGRNYQVAAEFAEATAKTAALGAAGEYIEEVGSIAGPSLASGESATLGQAVGAAATSPRAGEAATVGGIVSSIFGVGGYSGAFQKAPAPATPSTQTPPPDTTVTTKAQDINDPYFLMTKGMDIVEAVTVSADGSTNDPIQDMALALTNTIAHLENPLSTKNSAYIPGDAMNSELVKRVAASYPNIFVEDTPGGVILNNDPKLLNSTERTIVAEEKKRKDLIKERSVLERDLLERDDEIDTLVQQEIELSKQKRLLERSTKLKSVEEEKADPTQITDDEMNLLGELDQTRDVETQLEDTRTRLKELQGMDDIVAKQQELQRITTEMSDLVSRRDTFPQLRDATQVEDVRALEAQIAELETSSKVLQENYAQDPRSPILEKIAQIDEEVGAIDSLLTAGQDLDTFRKASTLPKRKSLFTKNREALASRLADVTAKKQAAEALRDQAPQTRGLGTGEEAVLTSKGLREINNIPLYDRQIENLNEQLSKVDSELENVSLLEQAVPDYDKLSNMLQEQPSQIYKSVYKNPIKNDKDLAARIRVEQKRKDSLLDELVGLEKQQRDLDAQRERLINQQREAEGNIVAEQTVSTERDTRQTRAVVNTERAAQQLLDEDSALIQGQVDIINQELSRIDNFLVATAPRVYTNSGIVSPVRSSYDPMLYSANAAKRKAAQTPGQNVSSPIVSQNVAAFTTTGVNLAQTGVTNPQAFAAAQQNTRNAAQQQAANQNAIQQGTAAASQAALKNTSYNNTISFLGDWFNSARSLGESIFQNRLEANYRVEAAAKKARDATQKLKRLVRESTVPVNVDDLNASLVWDTAGKAAYTRLPKPVRIQVSKMRNDIRRLSGQLKNSGMLTSNLVAVFDNNMDVYVNRSYEIFSDPDTWIPAVLADDVVMNRWLAHLSTHIPRTPAEPATAAGDKAYGVRLASMTEALLKDISSPASSIFSFFDMMVSSSPTNKQTGKLVGNTAILKKKDNTIAPELLDLLGVRVDISQNYMETVTKQARLLHNYTAQQQIRDIGLKAGIFKEAADITTGHTTLMRDDTLFSPLKGLYANESYVAAYEKAFDNFKYPPLIKEWIALSGISKGMATVYSLQSHPRNFLGNIGFLVANGYINMLNPLEGFREFKHAIGVATFGQFDDQIDVLVEGGKISPGAQKYVQKMYNKYVSLGLMRGVEIDVFMQMIKETAGISTLEQYLQKKNSFFANARRGAAQIPLGPTTLNAIEKGVDLGFKVTKGFAKMYAAEDAVFKIIGFRAERKRLERQQAYKNATEEELDIAAARIVRNQMPSYDMTSKAINALRAFPVIAPFVVFHSESARNFKNIVVQANKEIRSKDPEAVKAGYARLGGATGSMFMFAGIAAMSQALAGIGEEEEEAARNFAAPWDKLSNWMHLGKDDEGNMRYLNADNINPFATISNPVLTMGGWFFEQDQSFADMMMESVSQILKPYVQEDILTGKVYEGLKNFDSRTGRALYDARTDEDWVLKIAAHVGASLVPAAVGQTAKLWNAYNEETDKQGNKLNLPTEVIAIGSGQRANSLNPTTGIQFKSFEYQRSKEFANSELRRTLLSKATISENTIKDAVEQYKKRNQNNSIAMIEYVENARTLLVDDDVIEDALSTARLKNLDIDSILSGEMPEIVFTDSIIDRLDDPDSKIPKERLQQIEKALGKSIDDVLND